MSNHISGADTTADFDTECLDASKCLGGQADLSARFDIARVAEGRHHAAFAYLGDLHRDWLLWCCCFGSCRRRRSDTSTGAQRDGKQGQSPNRSSQSDIADPLS